MLESKKLTVSWLSLRVLNEKKKEVRADLKLELSNRPVARMSRHGRDILVHRKARVGQDEIEPLNFFF
jgi:hypothetical protein